MTALTQPLLQISTEKLSQRQSYWSPFSVGSQEFENAVHT
jgi:hypothetical protein